VVSRPLEERASRRLAVIFGNEGEDASVCV
jgi:hypothetical protein